MKIHKYLAHVLLVSRTMRTTMPLAFDSLGEFVVVLSHSVCFVLLFWHIYLTFCRFRMALSISRQLKAHFIIL